MSEHITIIDYVPGTNKQGFCVRVGPELPLQQRLANCIGFRKYGSDFVTTVYASFEEAYKVAVEWRNKLYPDFTVRADCTLA